MNTHTTISIELNDEQATMRLGQELASVADSGDIIALDGSLGVGKTVLARSFIRSLCGADEEVPSPTFTLVQMYDTLKGGTIWHFDMYRIKCPEEALELGIEDAFFDGISLIEWAEHLGGYLPRNHLKLSLIMSDNENSRTAKFIVPPQWENRINKILLKEKIHA